MHADTTAHELHQLLGDGGAQACAAVLARCARVLLGEAFEDTFQGVGHNTDAGIVNLEVQHQLAGRIGATAHFQADTSVIGEFDRVGNEVEQNFAQVMRIADQTVGCIRRDAHQEAQSLLQRRGAQHGRRRVDQFVQVERGAFENQLAGLDLGKIEHVIDLPQRYLHRIADDLKQRAFLGAQPPAAIQQFGCSQDAVERRAQLVTHARKEPPLGGVRFFRALNRGIQHVDEVSGIQRYHNEGEQRAGGER